MWHDMKPGTDVVDDIYYSANFYTSTAVGHIRQHNQSRSMFLYLPIQNVHSPYQLPPDWEVKDYPEMWDHTCEPPARQCRPTHRLQRFGWLSVLQATHILG